MLDILTPDHAVLPLDLKSASAVVKPTGVKWGLNPVSRRVFSRALIGTKKPGRYYFLTLTTVATSSPIKRCWDTLRRYLKNLYPRTVHFHVLTSEGKGQGVIHCILRMGRGERRVEVVPLRKWWTEYAGARQIKIVRVGKKRELARYIADQRYKKELAAEFAWQDGIVSWGFTKGWLPKGFTKAFGRFWHKSRDSDLGQREMFLHDWLLRCYDDPDQVLVAPVVWSGEMVDRMSRHVPVLTPADPLVAKRHSSRVVPAVEAAPRVQEEL
jgi:hypothetical protein